MAGEITGVRVTGDSSTRRIDYNSLANKPTIPTKLSDLTDDIGLAVTETDPTVPSWAKAQSKPTYTAQEVGALPDTTVIPSKTSDLTNDSGFLTTETDPTVPSWAKEPNKPAYTAQEVGALPDTTAIPSKTSDLTNDSGFLTSIPVDNDSIKINASGKLYVAFSNAEGVHF